LLFPACGTNIGHVLKQVHASIIHLAVNPITEEKTTCDDALLSAFNSVEHYNDCDRMQSGLAKQTLQFLNYILVIIIIK